MRHFIPSTSFLRLEVVFIYGHLPSFHAMGVTHVLFFRALVGEDRWGTINLGDIPFFVGIWSLVPGHVLVRSGELEGTPVMHGQVFFKLHIYVHILEWCVTFSIELPKQ